jgi:4-diphosphocytidyl-2-C-methyl-D-erythritol kinase
VTADPPTLRALAPAKINLGLFLGPVRDSDSRHELVSVMQSISLADELTLGPAPAGRVGDELVCPAVPGRPEQNLAARALREFRQRTGWQAPPLRLTVEKRIPLAAGLAGGSADAAAALRLARAASGLGDEALLLEIAGGLGADVPAQIAPGRWLASGAGERLQRLPPPRAEFGVLVLPASFELSTAAVYAEADRLGLARERSELVRLHDELASALGQGAAVPAASELLHNDLQRAAVSLRGEIADGLRSLGAAGASPALVSGSGPTAIGLYARPREEGVTLARAAASRLAERGPAPEVAVPVEAAFGEPVLLASGSLPGG